MGSKSKPKTVPRSGKVKGKRWKKGQSSTSNPESRRYREKAKNRFFSKSAGDSGLTVDALAQHDQSQEELEVDRVEPDRQTAGTFRTWATNWTECTNTTFSKVHRYWSSNSAFHKELDSSYIGCYHRGDQVRRRSRNRDRIFCSSYDSIGEF